MQTKKLVAILFVSHSDSPFELIKTDKYYLQIFYWLKERITTLNEHVILQSINIAKFIDEDFIF